MRYSPFYSNYSQFKKAKDQEMVKDILLSEVAEAIVLKRSEVIDGLNQSGITIDSAVETEKLIEVVMNNLENKKFIGRLALIIGKKDGEDFKSFMNMSGGKAKPQEYIYDICYAVSGNLKVDDKETLRQRVKDMTTKSGSGRTTPHPAIILSIIGVSAVAIYFLGIREAFAKGINMKTV